MASLSLPKHTSLLCSPLKPLDTNHLLKASKLSQVHDILNFMASSSPIPPLCQSHLLLLLGRCLFGLRWTRVRFDPPSFTLKDQDVKTVSLSKFKGKPLVLYFYSADETPGFTKQGIKILGLAVTLMTWGIKTKGPFFVSVFQPVLLVMLALADSFLFVEKLHTGSILGGLLIVAGLYPYCGLIVRINLILNPHPLRRCQFTQALHNPKARPCLIMFGQTFP